VATAAYPFTLYVRRFDSAIAYDRPEIVYRADEHELRYYQYRLWIAKPGRMVGEQVAKHLEAIGLFEAVTLRPTERVAHFELGGVVLSIDVLDPGADGETSAEASAEDRAEQPWRARLAMRLMLTSSDSGEIIWKHTFVATRDVARHDPRAVVATLTAILDEQLAQLGDELDHVFARITATRPRLVATAVAVP
jgi:ABC-type uncharacterized transport system auxiliary subunit